MKKWLIGLRSGAIALAGVVAGATLFTDNISKSYELITKYFGMNQELDDLSLRDPSPIYLGRSYLEKGRITNTVAVLVDFVVTKKSKAPITDCEIVFFLGSLEFKDQNNMVEFRSGALDRKVSGFFTFDKSAYSKDLRVRLECSSTLTGWLKLEIPKMPRR